jgi:site-specific DNA-methyltransferase (adenine-specific)
MFGVSRAEMARWLAEIGLLTPARSPTKKALKDKVCRILANGHNGALLLWDRQRTIAALRSAWHGPACRRRNGKDNGHAGAWSTPDWLFHLLDVEFHFTLDAAASPHNAKCKRFFTEKQDGRAQDWGEDTVWCNPPWAARLLRHWVRKAYEASRKGATVVLLIPNWRGYDWFDEYCVSYGEIRHVMNKVYFASPVGKTGGKECVVVIFGPNVKGYTNGPSIRKPKSGRGS